MQYQKTIITAVLLVLVSAAGFYFYRDANKDRSSGAEDEQNTLDTALQGITAEGGDYTVEEIPNGETLGLKEKAPDLDRATIFSEDLTPDVKNILTSRITALTTKLKENYTLVNSWIDLGAQWKTAGDYEGARLAWEYASLLSPSSNIPESNLGDLYAHYLNDYPKAEAAYKKAIGLNPNFIDSYRALYELYAFLYKEKSALTDDTLKEGLAANPDSIDLMILLAKHYKETGDIVQSKKYYEMAIAEAKKQGNDTLAETLEQEMARM